MSDEHTIRLRGPWQLQVGDGPSESVRIESANLSQLCGQAVGDWTLERRFRRPTNLDAANVWLAIEFNCVSVAVELNGNQIGETVPNQESRFPILPVDSLLEQNLLRLTGRSGETDQIANWKCEVALKIIEL